MSNALSMPEFREFYYNYSTKEHPKDQELSDKDELALKRVCQEAISAGRAHLRDHGRNYPARGDSYYVLGGMISTPENVNIPVRFIHETWDGVHAMLEYVGLGDYLAKSEETPHIHAECGCTRTGKTGFEGTALDKKIEKILGKILDAPVQKFYKS